MPFAIGAVVVGWPTTFHTPETGHFCPVDANIMHLLNKKGYKPPLPALDFSPGDLYIIEPILFCIQESFPASEADATVSLALRILLYHRVPKNARGF